MDFCNNFVFQPEQIYYFQRTGTQVKESYWEVTGASNWSYFDFIADSKLR